jgi:hypothetical protein
METTPRANKMLAHLFALLGARAMPDLILGTP